VVGDAATFVDCSWPSSSIFLMYLVMQRRTKLDRSKPNVFRAFSMSANSSLDTENAVLVWSSDRLPLFFMSGNLHDFLPQNKTPSRIRLTPLGSVIHFLREFYRA
jgi:hypothetical protein